MEPITTTIIASALAWGIGVVSDNVAADAYRKLKTRLKRKFGNDSEVAKAVDNLEARPDSAELREVLEKELDAAGANQDHEVRQAVQKLLEEKLATLPRDEIPGPAPLPQGSRMPLRRNRFFKGREDKLKALAEILLAGETTAIGQVPVAAATGLGGIGKTQIASEFVHRYGQYFVGGVYWLSLADASDVPAEIASCGGADGMELHPRFHTLSLEVRVRLVTSAWKSVLPRLLVFDNCQEKALLDQWRPTVGGCRVLVTSYGEQWDRALGVRALPLDVLGRQESVALLREHRPDLPIDDPHLDAIAHELGYLPLALELAGSYLARRRFPVTPEDYLKQLRRPGLLGHPSLQEGGTSPTGHVQNVERTFALSYKWLDTADPTDELAVALLARAACFAPGEPIPRDLLLSTLDLPDDDPDAVERAEDALGELAELGLLQTEEAGALRVHRLVAAFVRDVDRDLKKRKTLLGKLRAAFVRDVPAGEKAQAAVEAALLNTIGSLLEGGYPALRLVLQPHVRAVTEAAQERGDRQAARLCNELGHYLWMIGDFKEARPLHERALAICEEVLGEEHSETATSLNNLGMLLKDQGSYAEARPYLQRALAIREKVLGAEHPATAQSLNNLGVVLHAQGEYAEARPLYERALAIREEVLGEEHSETAQSLNNLAGLLRAQGDCGEARPLYERALAICEEVLGPQHPNTQVVRRNLASLE